MNEYNRREEVKVLARRKGRRSRPEAGQKSTLIGLKTQGVLPMSIGKLPPPTVKRTPLLTP